MYTNMAAVTKFIAKNYKTTTSASKTTWHFGILMRTSFVRFRLQNYTIGTSPLCIRIRIPNSNIHLICRTELLTENNNEKTKRKQEA